MRKLNNLPDTALLRLIDANLNRAREGIRVIEDTFRFLKDDKTVSSGLRRIRHSLDTAAEKLYSELVKSRSVVSDVGAASKENPHSGLRSLVFANFNRVKESLRVLEEYTRLLPGGSSAIFKKIRFSVYDMEKKVGIKYFAKKN